MEWLTGMRPGAGRAGTDGKASGLLTPKSERIAQRLFAGLVEGVKTGWDVGALLEYLCIIKGEIEQVKEQNGFTVYMKALMICLIIG